MKKKDEVNTLTSWNFGVTVVLVLASALMDRIGWDAAFIMGMLGAVVLLVAGIWMAVAQEDVLWGAGGVVSGVLIGVICWRFNPNVAEVLACFAVACGLAALMSQAKHHKWRRYLSAVPAFAGFAWVENLGFWYGAVAAAAWFILQVKLIAPLDAQPSEH